MKEIYDIATSLLNQDGSCRDLNFERPTWDGVALMVGTLPNAFSDCEATDHDGYTLSNPSAEDIQAMITSGGYAHLVLNGGTQLFKHLQVFVSEEDDGCPFVELTFIPQDVKKSESLREEFLAWACEICKQLQASRYYARYENASWKFGDAEEASGVFLVLDINDKA